MAGTEPQQTSIVIGADAEIIAELQAIPPADRPEQVVRWMVAGKSDAEIMQAVAAAWPQKSYKKFFEAVAERLKKSASTPPDIVRGWIYESRMHIFGQLMEIGDFAGALRALRDIEDAAQ